MRNRKIKKITLYETEDFKQFDTYKEAVAHQKEYDRKKNLNYDTFRCQINLLKRGIKV